VCVIAVSKSHEFFVESSSIFLIFFDNEAYQFASRRRNFCPDDGRDSTSTTSRWFCFRLTLRLFDDVSTASWYLLFQFRLQSFLWRVGIFSLFFLCCFYFLLKVHINFYISTFVLSNCYSSIVHVTFRPFRNIQRATRISVCVTAVSKSHKFFVKFIDFLIFSTTAPAPSHQRVIIFPWRRKGFDFDDESMFFNDVGNYGVSILWRRRDIDFSLDSHLSWTISRDLFVCRKSPSLQCHLVEYVVSSNMSVTTEC